MFYQYRHLAATECLTIVKDSNLVANILGHQNTGMVDRIYGHVVSRMTPGVSGLEQKLRMVSGGLNE